MHFDPTEIKGKGVEMTSDQQEQQEMQQQQQQLQQQQRLLLPQPTPDVSASLAVDVASIVTTENRSDASPVLEPAYKALTKRSQSSQEKNLFV